MDKIQIHSRIWLKKGGKNYLGNGRIELLKRIQEEGSISKASKKMYMSYKSAWDNLNQIKILGGEELIHSSNGGKGGGGTTLTQEGEKAIKVFECLEELKEEFWGSFSECQSLDEILFLAEKYKKFLKNPK